MLRAYPDHPADAIPMLERILSEEIKDLTDDEIRILCLAVIYHDIIGDCMAKGRDKKQIVKVIENEDDLEMLFAITIADTSAINAAWGLQVENSKSDFKSEILKLKGA